MKTVEKVLVRSADELSVLLGAFDENLNVLARETGAELCVTTDGVRISGEENNVAFCKKALEKLVKMVENGEKIDSGRVVYLAGLAKEGSIDDVEKVLSGVVAVNSRGKQIKYKTRGQKTYVDAINKNTVVFGVGPAGTGKTYLAVAAAASAYKNKEVEKIILTRPAVEAGERLGFLPGDLQSKVDPYLRPLYDALQEMFGLETYQKLIERGSIEIAPLAYMRGRTLSNAFIILDEAQNTTKEQMKMFLTRMGEGSKAVITGDVTQIDLPEGKASGLKHAVRILDGIEGIAIVKLTANDVVRHPLVMRIIKAYSDEEKAEIKTPPRAKKQ